MTLSWITKGNKDIDKRVSHFVLTKSILKHFFLIFLVSSLLYKICLCLYWQLSLNFLLLYLLAIRFLDVCSQSSSSFVFTFLLQKNYQRHVWDMPIFLQGFRVGNFSDWRYLIIESRFTKLIGLGALLVIFNKYLSCARANRFHFALK